MKKILFFSIFWLCQSYLIAQNQTVKGIIIDKQSEMPLIGATVTLISEGETEKGTTTDIDGYFKMEEIPVGRQAFAITYIGYEPLMIPNVVVTAGKEVILDAAMEESIENLSEVVVSAAAQKDKAQNELATISARTFSVEEVNRYSGGRGDVARLAGNFAGVSTADDSRNDIVIRGNSPTGVLWRINGVPIPNPNHFSTLGTTGGPVSALNPNMLKNSDFLTSAFPAEYGNALAGVFDLGFRKGNRDNHEFMLQIGAFTGVEGMAEGPISKKNGSSYLVAGRYAVTGIFGAAGSTNALPNYRDVAFNLDFGKSKLGNFTLFGIGGQSDIDFLHDEVEEDDLFAQPDTDAFPRSRFGVIGLRHNLILDETTYWRTVFSGSTSRNKFTENRLFNIDTEEEFSLRYSDVNNTEDRYSVSSFVNKKFNAKLTGRAGLLIENYRYDLSAFQREGFPDLDGDGFEDFNPVFVFDDNMTIYQFFAQIQYKFSPKWTFNLGLHTQTLSLNNNSVIEPRVALNYKLAPKHTLNIGYGLHHQNAPLPILLLQEPMADGTFEETNRDLEFTRSNHFVVGYDANLASDWRAKVEVYYQAIDKVPVEPTPTSFSILNVGDDFVFPNDVYNLQNEGKGTNYGMEFTLEKFYSKGYYGLLTASIFDSKYEGSDGIERNTAFNNGYVVNLLFGKEWKIGKEKRHAFSVDTKFTTAGGRYTTPVDLEASQITGREILIDDLAFTDRNDAYLRWDLKFGIKLNSKKRKLSQQLFFDFQNVTNRDNIFARRYNRATNEINQVNQIGFFPNFLYRIQF